MEKLYWRLLVTSILMASALSAQEKYSVVVYGGTPSGVVAAVAAAREGAKVIVLEQTRHIGGLNTSGIGTAETEHMIEETISGLPLEFYTRMGKKYGKTGPAWYFESHIAEQVFTEMLREAKVELVLDAWVDRVGKEGGAIKNIILTNGASISGDVFIDATYEGDLMARAGVSYTYGRESREQYQESLGGVRLLDKPIDVSPYDDEGHLLPGFVEAGTLKNGEASKRLINYNFRVMMSTREDRTPFPLPQKYDEKQFLILKRLLLQHPETRLTDIIDRYHWDVYPEGKYETNNKQNAIISLGLFGGNAGYPDAGYEKRAVIYQEHKDWTLGLFHFLLTDPSVPEHLRKEIGQYGLAKDEFADNGNFPYYLYVREARRMKGAYVQTQKDIFTDTRKADAVALGSHFVDCHHVQKVAISKTQYINEGRIWVKVGQPYELSYRIITPISRECTNLLVPVAVSASHVGFCSIRVEVTWMQLGQAAGVAAALSARGQKPVQQIDIRTLQRELMNAGVILSRNAQQWVNHDQQ